MPYLGSWASLVQYFPLQEELLWNPLRKGMPPTIILQEKYIVNKSITYVQQMDIKISIGRRCRASK